MTDKEPLVVKKKNHKFYLWLTDAGNIDYRIDQDPTVYTAKELIDNRVVFKESIELLIDDNVEFTDGIVLEDLDYTELKAAQNQILKKNLEKKDEFNEISIEGKSKKELLSMVDQWKKSNKVITKTGENKEKIKKKYTVHSFKIGRENYRMTEREIDGKQIINPDYKVMTDYKRAGGLAVKEGDVYFWQYYFESEEASEVDPTHKKGYWDISRRLSLNELICYLIIQRYGVYSKHPEDVK